MLKYRLLMSLCIHAPIHAAARPLAVGKMGYREVGMWTDFPWCVYGEASPAQQPSLVIYQYLQLPLMVKRDVRTWDYRIFINRILRDLLSADTLVHGHV